MAIMVPAFRVKAAVLPAVRKQLRASGLRADGFTVRFTGTGAYTAFDYWPDGDDKYAVSGFINYPAINDAAPMSRIEADMFAAYSLHELGHVLFSDSVQTKAIGKDRLLFKIWNGIEDPRIEAAQVASGNAKGSRKAFRLLLNKLLQMNGGISAQFNPASINDAPFALALMGRARLGNSTSYTAGLLARIPEPKRAIYAAALDALALAPLDRVAGTKATIQIAKDFLEAWNKVATVASAPQVNPVPPSKPEKSGLDYESPEDVDTPDEEEEFEDVPDIENGPDFGGFDEQADAFEEMDADDDNDDDSDDDFELDGDVADERAEFSDENAEMDDGTAVGGELPEDADGEEEDIPVFGGNGNNDFEDNNDAYDDEKAKSPEPDLGDVAERINARNDMAPLPDCPRGKMVDVGKLEFADVSKATETRRLNVVSDIKFGALKAQLVRLFRAPEVCGWDGGQASGRFDRKMSSRAMTGAENVFKKRWVTDGMDTAVTVLVDMSGSMKVRDKTWDYATHRWVKQGKPIDTAVKVAYAIADAAESAQAEVSVVGFQTEGWSPGSSGNELDGTRKAMGYECCEAVPYLTVFKKFGASMAKSRMNFTHMAKLAGGGTPDYASLKIMCEQIALRPEARKVVLVLTDGCGDQNLVKRMSEFADKALGVDVIGIGIGMGSLEQFRMSYPNGELAPTIESLVGVTLDKLNKTLERRMLGRRTM